MKVGDILKTEIKDVPGLHYPCKIKIYENYNYPKQKKLENTIFLENCNSFLHNIHTNKTYKSYSQKKNLNDNTSKSSKNQPSIKKFFMKKNSQNFSKVSIPNILLDNLPIIGDSTPKINSKRLCLSNVKPVPAPFNERSLFKKKIQKIKSLNAENINMTSYTLSSKKRCKASSFHDSKSINQIRIENLFNAVLKNKKNKKPLIQNSLEYRIQSKFVVLNNIIDKLNTPIFIYNKTDIN